MNKLKFNLCTLLLLAPAIGVGATIVIRLMDAAAAFDVTDSGSPTCQIHNLSMTKKTAEMTYGMRSWTQMDDARRALFPHADEVHNTGFCMPLQQRLARVYVCAKCTKVRKEWIADNP